ncbi:MAG: hypothetical protein ACO25B_09120 [Chitinophagaceae bacterium]
MKKIIIIFLLLGSSAMLFGQQSETKHLPAPNDYLMKSKKQKTTAWIFLGTGAGLIATSIIIPRGKLVDPGICIAPVICNDKYKNDGIKGAFFIAGGISALSSIPFFVVSKKNREKATSIGLIHENTVHLSNQNLVHSSFPALKLKIIL